MSNAKILEHPAFNRPPVQNARRRGPTPRDIPMLNRERRHREFNVQQDSHDELSHEEQILEYEQTIQEVARGLLLAARAIKALDQKLQGALSRG